MANVVILNLPRITFTSQVADQLFFKLPPDCCLPSSSRHILTYSFQTYNNHRSDGVIRIDIASWNVTMYGDVLFATFNPVGYVFDIYDIQIIYNLA